MTSPDGSIAASSTLGQGSTFGFTVNIPIDVNARSIHTTDDDVKVTASGQSAKIIARPPQYQTADRINILVAEDFALNQDVVRLMLEDSKYLPIFANNGLEALNLFKKTPTAFKAVLMDISMPVMDGYEASEGIYAFIRENQLEKIPIVALTGHALKHDREKCLNAYMDDYLTKPVKQVDLFAVLDKWLITSQQKTRIA